MRQIKYQVYKMLIRIKWYFLGDYYGRLAVQARYLYGQSQLFKDRWQQIDLDFAETTFDNVAVHFFHKAQQEHIHIRARILLDSLTGRTARPYAMREGNIF